MFNWMVKQTQKKKGFTLIELIVVIAILGILAAILIPQFSGFQDKARATQALTDAKQIATAMDGLYIEKGTWAAATITNVMVTDLAGLTGVTDRTWDTGKDQETLHNGAFTWEYTIGAKSWRAGRAAATDPVTMLP